MPDRILTRTMSSFGFSSHSSASLNSSSGAVSASTLPSSFDTTPMSSREALSSSGDRPPAKQAIQQPPVLPPLELPDLSLELGPKSPEYLSIFGHAEAPAHAPASAQGPFKTTEQPVSTHSPADPPTAQEPLAPPPQVQQLSEVTQLDLARLAALPDGTSRLGLGKGTPPRAQFAKKLPADQRFALLSALSARIGTASTPEQAKLHMSHWLTVLHGAMLVHRPEHKAAYRQEQRSAALWSLNPPVALYEIPRMRERRDDYRAHAARPEYAGAFDVLMATIRKKSLSPELRDMAVDYIEKELLPRGLIAPAQLNSIRDHGVRELAEMNIPVGPYNEEAAGVAADLAKQKEPLETVMGRWAKRTGVASSWSQGEFDHQPGAREFARVLSRMEPSFGMRADRKTRQEVGEVLELIAHDHELRAVAFAGATTALGTCGDNVTLGWANLVGAVRNHAMAKAVAEKRIDEPQLKQWAGQQFRLAALEQEVLKASVKNQHISDPVEVMLYVKKKLRSELDLPAETSSKMRYRLNNWLKGLEGFDLQAFATSVRQQEADHATMSSYLLSNETWRTGMQQLHAAEFAKIDDEFDKDPFYDRELPRQEPEFAAEMHDYMQEGAELNRKRSAAKETLLLQLASREDEPARVATGKAKAVLSTRKQMQASVVSGFSKARERFGR